MSAFIENQLQLLVEQSSLARGFCQRAALVLEGDGDWLHSLVTRFSLLCPEGGAYQLGGEAIATLEYLPAKQGKRLLGKESLLIVVSLDDSFDANSFNAAVGTLVGGGMLLFTRSSGSSLPSWLQHHLTAIPSLLQSELTITNLSEYWPIESGCSRESDVYAEQTLAIAMVEKVVFGHRKRPLVITADRGRGKSSALGIAAGLIQKKRPCRILVTAPNRSAVAPIFEYSAASMDECEAKQRQIEFIAPDDLLQNLPHCDLLMVDEAAAIPVPMLKRMVAHYHRLVISSTVHGYEGCGRGFSLKFLPWLQAERPGTKVHTMSKPIRWNNNDPLEAWCSRAFLLSAEMDSLEKLSSVNSLSPEELQFFRFDISEALSGKHQLSSAFALLVNAHYQTSPSDLMLLLTSPNMSLYLMTYQDSVIGSVLTNEEGQLQSEVIEKIQLGQSRPSGHLIPVELCNHLALTAPAAQCCVRVMRIAVHPLLQSQGVGSEMLIRLKQSLVNRVDYLATSFGVTDELLAFWQHNQFVPLKLGSSKDKASGTYSASLVFPLSHQSRQWIDGAKSQFERNLVHQLRRSNQDIDTFLAWRLYRGALSSNEDSKQPSTLLTYYAKGGNALNSCRADLLPFIQSLIASDIAVDDELVLAIALQEKEWDSVADTFGCAGRKQAESRFRASLSELIQRLQCKLSQSN